MGIPVSSCNRCHIQRYLVYQYSICPATGSSNRCSFNVARRAILCLVSQRAITLAIIRICYHCIMHFVFICALGWLLSFLGQLPLGTISFTTTQIAVQENFSNARKFSIGVAIIEIIYLRLVLSGVDWIMEHKLFFSV